MQVKIKRNAYSMGRLLPLTIYQDGKPIGKINTEETLFFDAVEGSTLVAKQLGVRSNAVEVKEGDYLEISGKPWLGALQAIALITLLFVPSISDSTLRTTSYFILPIIYFSSLFLVENFKLEKKN
ncbi:hypothetical protein [Facklamia sp. 7083-14-GEN3]|uniref:hypothetical protein n=1 Tax=Facklamia sp. 7083-14-GEN3 TaxID=2973478 RepID=UPI00215C3477|nr:hypothetical protein [Facklamia sp. 7083-14-GEN3]MCR8969807.1 hypothetical protein [Facklamia sp. 7083-14-GEN3]